MRAYYSAIRPNPDYNLTAGHFEKIEIREPGLVVADGKVIDARGLVYKTELQRSLWNRGDGSSEIVINYHRNTGWDMTITEVIEAPADVPPPFAEVYDTFPAYVKWPADVDKRPQSIVSQAERTAPQISDAAFADRMLPSIQAGACKFEKEFVWAWPLFGVQEDITAPKQNALYEAERKRQNTTAGWCRAWIGLAACTYWHLKHSEVKLLDGWSGGYSRDKIKDTVELVKNIDCVVYYQRHTDEHATALSNRQIGRLAEDGSVADVIYTAPTAAWHKSLCTRWYRAARFGFYPQAPTLMLSGATVGTESLLNVTDTGGSLTGVSYTWQLRDSEGIKDISSAQSATYTPIAENKNKDIRAIITYNDKDHVRVTCPSEWVKVA